MKLRWTIKILGTLILVIAAAVMAGSIYLGSNFKTFLMLQKGEELKRDLNNAAWIVAELFSSNQKTPPQLRLVANRISRNLQGRVTLLSADGRVLADSALSREVVEKGEDFSNRPEILAVKTKGYGQTVRFSPPLQSNTLFGALPLRKGEALWGYIRIGLPLSQTDKDIAVFQRDLVLAGGLTLLLAILLGLLLIRSLGRPLGELNNMVQRMAQGDLKQPFHLLTQSEFSELALSLESLGAGLMDKIDLLESETGELKTLLASMREGVLVTDEKGRIILINPFLNEILGGKVSWKKRSVQEAFMSAELQDAVEAVLKGDPFQRLQITFGRDLQRYFEVQVVALSSAHRPLRAVALFHETTELRYLLKVRQAFVANTSWELGTPLTSINGQLDILLPLISADSPEVHQGLTAIQKEVKRLNLLVADMLELAKLDVQEKAKMNFERVKVREILETTLEMVKDQAQGKIISLDLEAENLSEEITAFWEKDRVLQALFNVLDNALKYTPSGGRVRLLAKCVRSRESGVRSENGPVSELATQDSELHRDFLEITVADNGPGIPKEHLPRIFERFYRVDRAHSRALGGTGLGLSIVKHIVESHGGTVEVQGTLGKGTTFILKLPMGLEKASNKKN
jgi:two-component system, OmpR family, phosphate regulon sensor histidine kinase PhoR